VIISLSQCVNALTSVTSLHYISVRMKNETVQCFVVYRQ